MFAVWLILIYKLLAAQWNKSEVLPFVYVGAIWIKFQKWKQVNK